MVYIVFLLSIGVKKKVDYDNMKKNDIIDGENKTINEDKQKRSSSRKPSFCVRSLKNKWFVLPSILFILKLVILIVVLIKGKNRINNLKDDLRIKEKFIAEAENQSNQTMEQSNKRLLEQQETIEQLNKNITELKKKNNQTIKQFNDHLLQNNATIQQLNKNITELKKQNNQTIKQLNDRLLQNNATIEGLNKTFIECKTKRSEPCHNILELGIEINHITLTILFSYQKKSTPKI
jgi:DNA repair exonuclease SbcCD ATPase subunit